MNDADKKPKNPDAPNGVPDGEFNPPEVNKKAKPTQRAVSSAKQAWEIAKGIRNLNNNFRVKRNAEIRERYDGGLPFNQQALKRTGQDWRNNFSTLWLAGIIDRVRPKFKDAIRRAPSLCNAKLPDFIEKATDKAKKFNKRISNTIRAWPAFGEFLDLITQELVLIGYATPAWLDSNHVEWRPWMYRSDEAFLPDGTGQHAGEVTVFLIEKDMLVHEFLKPLKDLDAAKKAGYNIENCVTVINRATEEHGDKSELDRLDDIRNGALESSFKRGAKAIKVYFLFVQDYSGEVDLWEVDADKGEEIRHKEGHHASMDDAISLLTIQTGGNCKFYSSKGTGRSLLNLSTAIERGRNLGMDQMYLSGLVLLKMGQKDRNKFQPIIRHPFVIIDSDIEVAPEAINFNSEVFLAMDAKLSEIGEMIAGAFIPATIEQNKTPSTKIADAAKVQRQEEVKEGVLGRFHTQFSQLVETMKRKICDPRNVREAVRVWQDRKTKRQGRLAVVSSKVMAWLKKVFAGKEANQIAAAEAYESKIADAEAVECIVAMLEDGLTVEEIGMLADHRQTEVFSQEGDETDQNTLTFVAANKGNPLVNQTEAIKVEAEIMLTPDQAERLVISDEIDQTIKAEATRMQILEMGEMMDGNAIPVSPRDNHKAHREALLQPIQTLVGAITQPATATPQLIQTARLVAEHYMEHLNLDPESQLKPDQAKAEAKAIQGVMSAIDQAEKQMAQMAEQMQADPSAMPVPVNGQPPQAAPDGTMPGVDPTDTIAKGADVMLRAKEADQRDREIALQERQQGHQEQMDVIDRQIETARVQREKIQASVKAGGTGDE